MPSSFHSRRAAAICTRSSTRHPANSRLLMFTRICPAGNRPGGERAHCPCQHPFPHIQPGLSSARPCRSHTVYTLQRIVVSVGTCLPADCVQTKALIRGNGWTNRVKARLPSAAQRTATRNDRMGKHPAPSDAKRQTMQEAIHFLSLRPAIATRRIFHIGECDGPGLFAQCPASPNLDCRVVGAPGARLSCAFSVPGDPLNGRPAGRDRADSGSGWGLRVRRGPDRG